MKYGRQNQPKACVPRRPKSTGREKTWSRVKASLAVGAVDMQQVLRRPNDGRNEKIGRHQRNVMIEALDGVVTRTRTGDTRRDISGSGCGGQLNQTQRVGRKGGPRMRE